jgi:hypothetical protein
LSRFGETKDQETASIVAFLCLLTDQPVGELQQLLPMAAKWPSEDQFNSFGLNWFPRMALGLTHYRAGQLEAARHRVAEAIATNPQADAGPNWLLMALIHHRLGHPTEARRWLERGLRWRPPPDNGVWNYAIFKRWHFRLLHQLLRREADALQTQAAARSREQRIRP